ncbi:Cd(II)/Pb(II)-responsive transcriptional regulator [Carnimonas nigrificans]|uniref:Cd(II)/Pb(II)-responsive transcriptional regulator n=1 Tax=Carnimonas nigrificans TaxID=64323 RepID=UPI0004B1C991|nr:Cd(II)/Pb(II)-responsive transcriptional regulator [Carnimonas nigrificans]
MAGCLVHSSLRIGELAEHAGCAVETIRYYERIGLLPEARRSAANYRLYSSVHAEQLCFIRRCRSLDMSLDEISTLLALRSSSNRHCQEIEQVVSNHLSHVQARIEELEMLRDQLTELHACCGTEQEGESCAILTRLERHSTDQPSSSTEASSSTAHIDGAH